jgi:hypothetical protein
VTDGETLSTFNHPQGRTVRVFTARADGLAGMPPAEFLRRLKQQPEVALVLFASSSTLVPRLKLLPEEAPPEVQHHGGCLCGAITFAVTGPLPAPDACHCTICRKSSGHYWVSTDVPRGRVAISGTPTWFQSSPKVRRGFCGTCGASLFFDPPHKDFIAIAMGAFDTKTSTRIEKHIFVADKGDYYEITDGAPQHPQ